MNEGYSRRGAVSTRTRERAKLAERPDRIALWAFVLAILAMVMAAASAHAGSGGTSLTTSSTTHESRYHRIWDNFNHRDHHWAHRTSECESGGNPKAIGGGGTYRGAFQFTRDAWKTSPKSPGGDPIRYSWKTQAVVAVLLKHKVGSRPWPVCG